MLYLGYDSVVKLIYYSTVHPSDAELHSLFTTSFADLPASFFPLQKPWRTLLLLRDEGYPCVFHPDLDGAHYKDKGKVGSEQKIWLVKVDDLESLHHARRNSFWKAKRLFCTCQYC